MLNYPQISPEIFRIGPFAVRWYGLMYVIGFLIGFQVIKSRARRGLFAITYRASESMITYLVVGMLIGARLTYVFVYNWEHFSQNLGDVFKIWQGGLSFHGAAAGMIAASILFARKHKVPGYAALDTLAMAATPGLFFGRVGNFINAELYGRATDLPWAMVFPTDPERLPRHPSQLYEAFAEGILLFACLTFIQEWSLKRKAYWPGLVGGNFLLLYGLFRFCVEFTRQPDAQLGLVLGPLTMGQLLCVITSLVGIWMLWHSRRQHPQAVQPEPATPKFLNS